MNRFDDYFIRKKKRNYISMPEKIELSIIGFLIGVLLFLLFINYTISPKNEVAIPIPSESVGQDGQRDAGNSAEFKNASQSADWFIIPNDGATYVQ